MITNIPVLLVMAFVYFQTVGSQFPQYISPHIKTLDLTHKRIRFLPREGFCHISHLTKIHLGDGVIHYIHKDGFGCLTNLTHLAIIRAKLRSLPDGVFRYLINLQELDLQGELTFVFLPLDGLFLQ